MRSLAPTIQSWELEIVDFGIHLRPGTIPLWLQQQLVALRLRLHCIRIMDVHEIGGFWIHGDGLVTLRFNLSLNRHN